MEKETKLLNRPVEKETTILAEHIVMFKEFLGLMELWTWEGVTGSSIIYLKDDALAYERETLINSLFEQIKLPRDPQLTICDREDYVYLNFNFKTD